MFFSSLQCIFEMYQLIRGVHKYLIRFFDPVLVFGYFRSGADMKFSFCGYLKHGFCRISDPKYMFSRPDLWNIWWPDSTILKTYFTNYSFRNFIFLVLGYPPDTKFRISNPSRYENFQIGFRSHFSRPEILNWVGYGPDIRNEHPYN